MTRMTVVERPQVVVPKQPPRNKRPWSVDNPPPPMRGGATAGAFVCRNLVFSATAGAKTVLVVASPSQHGLSLVEFGISFDGVTASAVPALVELTQLTLGAAGTPAASPPAAVQVRGRTGATAPTVTHNYTGEPTTHT